MAHGGKAGRARRSALRQRLWRQGRAREGVRPRRKRGGRNRRGAATQGSRPASAQDEAAYDWEGYAEEHAAADEFEAEEGEEDWPMTDVIGAEDGEEESCAADNEVEDEDVTSPPHRPMPSTSKPRLLSARAKSLARPSPTPSPNPPPWRSRRRPFAECSRSPSPPRRCRLTEGPEALPEPWIRCWSQSYLLEYFWNESTQEAVWERCEIGTDGEVVDGAASASAARPAALVKKRGDAPRPAIGAAPPP